MAGGGEQIKVAHPLSSHRRRRFRRWGQLFYGLAAALVLLGAALVLRPSSAPNRSAAASSSDTTVLAATTATTTVAPRQVDLTPEGESAGNTPPVIEIPGVVSVPRTGTSSLAGITVTDAQAAPTDTLGVLLYSAEGSITISATDHITFHAPNGGHWVPFTGTIAAVRAALATIRYTPNAGVPNPSLTIVVSDGGHQGRYKPLNSTRTLVIKYA